MIVWVRASSRISIDTAYSVSPFLQYDNQQRHFSCISEQQSTNGIIQNCRIAQCKKPHTIAEELILPASVDMELTLLGEK